MNQELSTMKQLICLINSIRLFLFVITFALSVVLLPIVSCICELAGVHSLILYKVNVILLMVTSIFWVGGHLITKLFSSLTTEEQKKLEQSKDTSTEEQKESKQSKDISTEEQKKLELTIGHMLVIGYFAFTFITSTSALCFDMCNPSSNITPILYKSIVYTELAIALSICLVCGFFMFLGSLESRSEICNDKCTAKDATMKDTKVDGYSSTAQAKA